MESIDLLVLRTARDWLAAGERVLLATVARTWGSSPRPVGSMMALRSDGRVVGSVSGGCIEDDLIHRYTTAYGGPGMQTGRPEVVRYGVSAEDAHRFGLPCGGTLQLILEFEPSAEHLEQLLAGLADLDRNTRDLQESVMSIRMIPMSTVFSRFPRMLRDLAGKLGKKIDLITLGEATELDKGLVEKITDPLTHLVRNSVDHGIEMPEERLAAGKSEHGTLTLAASHQGGSIVIEVRDDGRGMNREKILKKARERGMDVSDSMPDQDVWQLIFAPGFSTADVVTDVSGRGVGMDVVKRNIAALGGSVEIESTQGKGMRVAVRLPLTLAIMDGMSVGVSDEVYILPLSSVVESFLVKAEDVNTVANGTQLVKVRDEYMPVFALEKTFRVPRSDTSQSSNIMVVVESDGSRVALLVDELLGQHQVVVKNLESNYRKVPNVSGATILGDGTVALILDTGALVRRARH